MIFSAALSVWGDKKVPLYMTKHQQKKLVECVFFLAWCNDIVKTWNGLQCLGIQPWFFVQFQHFHMFQITPVVWVNKSILEDFYLPHSTFLVFCISKLVAMDYSNLICKPFFRNAWSLFARIKAMGSRKSVVTNNFREIITLNQCFK